MFSEQARTQAKAQATAFSTIKKHPRRSLHSIGQMDNADLTCFATDLSLCYNSLDTSIRIAVHYELL